MSTILLTGATGYLGSNILRTLVERDHEIVVLKRSFSNPARIRELSGRFASYDIDAIDLEDAFRDRKIEMILHCATDYGRKNRDSLQIVEANLLLPLRLLELGHKHGVNIFINTDTILDKRVNKYSLSKSQFKEWLVEHSRDMACFNVALEHFYGPGDDKTKFVSFVIHELLTERDRIELTPGEQERDFIFIDDTVDAFVRIIEHAEKTESGFFNFEVGSGSAITIRAFVELLKRACGNERTDLMFGAVPYRPNEVMSRITDTTPLNRLGWRTKHTLIQGIEKTIEFERKELGA
jgi:CDP-paratose synthetase